MFLQYYLHFIIYVIEFSISKQKEAEMAKRPKAKKTKRKATKKRR